MLMSITDVSLSAACIILLDSYINTDTCFPVLDFNQIELYTNLVTSISDQKQIQK